MKALQILKKILGLSLFLASLNSSTILAQTSTFEVGTASLSAQTGVTATTASVFTRVNFSAPFAIGTVPNVFPMTPEFGTGAADSPCTIRIRNINNTGFDAVCLEPVNEVRDSPAVNFNYVAMLPGTLNIPVVGSADTVRFESRCSVVSNQVFGPNCNNCTLAPGGVQSYATQAFLAPAFATPPAVLTQISTTNNVIPTGPGLPVGEPETLEAAVRTNSLNTTGFQWALDRMEAGNGLLATSETMCYLAVARNNCVELDFSSINGPASVDFSAIYGGNVDGHNDGASSGEGASFPACFTSQPLALGNARSRRGNNGGMLRLASVNTAEAIFTFDEDRVSDTERSHIDEEISAIAFSSSFTTPVTLNKAQVSQLGSKTTFKWQTSSETFHLGFHLWGESNSGWEQLNNRLIPGAEFDTAETNRYKRTIKLNRQQRNEIQRFGISTIDNTGFEEFYGPFELNIEYGAEANNEPVDWAATRSSYEQNMRARGFVKKNQRWRKVSNKVAQKLIGKQFGENSSIVNLELEANGIHALSAQRILDLLPSWNGVALNTLALTLNGKPVARDIISNDKRLSGDDQIIFNAKVPNGKDAVYLNNYVYQLRLDRSRTIAANYFDSSIPSPTGISLSTGMVSVVATKNKVYSAGIHADEPWYDKRLVSRGTATSANYTIDFTRPIDRSAGAILDYTIHGGINLKDPVDDHHVQVLVNGTVIDDVMFDGLTRISKRLELPADLLTQTNNSVTVTVVGDTGLFADLILVDNIALSAAELLSGYSSYDFFSNTDSSYTVSHPRPASAHVYAYTSTGQLTKVKPSINANGLTFNSLPGVSSLNSDLRFSISEVAGLSQPSGIRLADVNLQHKDAGDLLIIAHPNFIGDQLADYADYKRDNGYEVTVVDWLELVETYGYGNNTPQALNNFLAQAYPLADRTPELLNNVLIVGGHTYDYLGNLDQNIVNFIPTHYRAVSIFNFTPSDNVFADLNNDQIPDIAIGRWPVRTQADLSTIIKKAKDWQANRDASPYQDALLLSQPPDSSRLNFAKQLDMRVGIPLDQLSEFQTVSKISMQQLLDTGVENPVQTARDEIKNQLNLGLELLSFNGHGSYGSWGFQGVVNTDFVKSLSNHGKPTLLMPLACYTSNYEHPSINTLAHQWLFAGDQGAAAIHGASVLGDYRENAIFVERYLNNVASSKTIGEAIFKAKNEMASANQMLHNWAYLGDPTLPLR